MSKSNKYGYSGVDIPTQAAFANVGKFDPAEINELVQEDKWTTFGQLELIETQTISSATADFTALQETTYNVHLFTLTDCNTSGQTELGIRVSNDNGSSFETASYQFANQRGYSNGSFAERKSTSQGSIRLGGDVTTYSNSVFNGYFYMYNAGDSAKFTYFTSHNTFTQGTIATMEFGSGVYNNAESINAIRIGEGASTTAFTSGIISAYGIKEYS